ncbi:hypothetical protein [Paractinoplanes rishiriensis]|uniref:Uncharacterized protein n=1 Tax=Paractinoplanes rishiriensis TaxID=1050105 RepID=A0A919K1C1_9ACTN|nr:hypothetical protein [Actinoplanes rishiriensis]GIE94811.1 hypothetical protein Ari01nite_22760 [Actinoplanes rishiriensis]
MRLWNWVKDHRTQSIIGLVALLVAVLALARDVIGFQIIDPVPHTTAAITQGPSAETVRRGPAELRMIGGDPNVVETEVDLDSAAANWGVNGCALKCDLNFRGSPNGIEEAYGQMAEAPADWESCRSTTAYGFTLSPRKAAVGAQMCVLTDEGRHAGLVVKEVRKSDRDHVESITFEVTVWER